MENINKNANACIVFLREMRLPSKGLSFGRYKDPE